MSVENTKAGEVQLGKYGPAFAVLGIVGLVLTGVIGLGSGGDAARVSTLQSYLFAVMLFMSLTLGCFGLTLLQHVLQGKWGLPILRIFEAGGGVWNFVLMMVLFGPILRYAADLYPWARGAEYVASDAVLAHRAAHYLNWTDIWVRFIVYFGAWITFAALMRTWVKKQEETGRFKFQQKRTNLASPGLVLIVLTVTFAYTDWIMALDPHWWSTMYAFWFISGMALAAVSFAAVISCVNASKAPYNQIVSKSWTNDIGNLMFVFTMLWGYTNLGQYLIIWHGNLPETATYLVNRSLGQWSNLSFALVMGQFFIPFFALLSPTVKKTPKWLAFFGVWILVFRLVDHFHVIEPFFRAQMSVHLVDLLALVGVGGLWAAVFSMNVKQAPLFPSYDPRILEAEHAH